ncbi:hypothetical protein LWI28_020416 [Acer negundo]|uniref:Uncharacterized protein n=1 Tax=Acer negundo TaxID=4023 RepID=A0AAD5JA99_ACENE|nr:hypothetical protein LWI28_020416 [Acer negundo]
MKLVLCQAITVGTVMGFHSGSHIVSCPEVTAVIAVVGFHSGGLTMETIVKTAVEATTVSMKKEPWYRDTVHHGSRYQWFLARGSRGDVVSKLFGPWLQRFPVLGNQDDLDSGLGSHKACCRCIDPSSLMG